MPTVLNTLSSVLGVYPREVLKKNRYCVACPEKPQTIYCFTTPVFDETTGKMVNNSFMPGNGYYEFHGSNGLIRIDRNSIRFTRCSDVVEVYFSSSQEFALSPNGRLLKSKEYLIYPTLNGVLVKEAVAMQKKSFLRIVDQSSTTPKYNSKYFALMKDRFLPLFTLSAMYGEDKQGCVFYNATLSHKKCSNAEYRLELDATPKAYKIIYEMNLYEPKLIQDTTVESHRPHENNIYGSVSFIGKSPNCGTQFLYSRIDVSKVWNIKTAIFESIKLYIPYYMRGEKHFQLFAPFKRFCSSGSNWINKVQSSGMHVKSGLQNGFFVFDLSTHLLIKNGQLKENEGFVFKPNVDEESFSIIATADNYFTPQLLEFKLKN